MTWKSVYTGVRGSGRLAGWGMSNARPRALSYVIFRSHAVGPRGSGTVDADHVSIACANPVVHTYLLRVNAARGRKPLASCVPFSLDGD